MSYAGALFFVRHFIHCPWKSQSSPLKGLDLSFTVHSLKATLLSWGPQLHSVVSRELRLAQDHHKEPNDSLNAYGRDSVWGSLHYQRILIDQVRSGFRPQIPQHRGAQQPLVEPAVMLEFFRKDLPSVQWRWFRGSQALDLEDIPPDEEADSSSSSVSSSDSEEAPSGALEKGRDVTVCDEILMARYRRVNHALVCDDHCRPESLEFDGRRWKTACAKALKASEAAFVDSLQSGDSLCQHPGCRKAWSTMD